MNNTNNTNNTNNNNKRKLHEVSGYRKGMSKTALWAGICAIAGMFIGGLALPIVALALGTIALAKKPDKHDKYWAISSIVLAGISVMWFLL